MGMVFCCFASFVFAQVCTVKLKDGNVLRGKVVSKENGVYKIQTLTLGLLSVAQADIASIEEAASQGQASEASTYQSRSNQSSSPVGSSLPQVSPEAMESYRQKIAANPQIMDTVSSLAEDKEVLEIFSDPELKDAILRQDVEYLKNNEKFLKMADHPALQKIVQELSSQESESGN
jgi:hypothetical protein